METVSPGARVSIRTIRAESDMRPLRCMIISGRRVDLRSGFIGMCKYRGIGGEVFFKC